MAEPLACLPRVLQDDAVAMLLAAAEEMEKEAERLEKEEAEAEAAKGGWALPWGWALVGRGHLS